MQPPRVAAVRRAPDVVVVVSPNVGRVDVVQDRAIFHEGRRPVAADLRHARDDPLPPCPTLPAGRSTAR